MINPDLPKHSLYLICLEEKISPQLLNWFENSMVITTSQSKTILVSSITDQAELHGLLNKIRDLNLTLLSMNKVEIPQQMDPR
jgi:hypothetical protein